MTDPVCASPPFQLLGQVDFAVMLVDLSISANRINGEKFLGCLLLDRQGVDVPRPDSRLGVSCRDSPPRPAPPPYLIENPGPVT